MCSSMRLSLIGRVKAGQPHPASVSYTHLAMNKYLVFVGKAKLRLKSVKVQQRSYLENVISNADYIFLKNKLKGEDNLEWYFVVRFLAATGDVYKRQEISCHSDDKQVAFDWR